MVRNTLFDTNSAPKRSLCENCGLWRIDRMGANSLLKKASCLFQLTKSKKCDFYFSCTIKGLAAFDCADTSMYRGRLLKSRVFQQPANTR